MGDTEYLAFSGNAIHVNADGQVVIVTSNGTIVMTNVTANEGYYVATASVGGTSYKFYFYFEAQKVTEIYQRMFTVTKDSFLPKEKGGEIEKAIAALMGTTAYASEDNIVIRVNSDGEIEYVSGSGTALLSDGHLFSALDGGDYAAIALDGSYRFIFYEKDQKVTSIKRESSAGKVEFLPSAEFSLASLIGTNKYTNNNAKLEILVNEDGRIVLVAQEEQSTSLLADNFIFYLNDLGNYIATSKGADDHLFIFCLAANKVTQIEEYHGEEPSGIYYPVLDNFTAPKFLAGWYVGCYYSMIDGYDELKSRVHDLLSSDGLNGESWSATQQSELQNSIDWQKNNGEYPNGQVASDGTFSAGTAAIEWYMAYLFCDQATLAEGANWKIYIPSDIGQETLTDDDLYVSGTFGQGLATAIDNIGDIDDQKAQKALKALHNGQLIIIRNGQKYDLNGRKL